MWGFIVANGVGLEKKYGLRPSSWLCDDEGVNGDQAEGELRGSEGEVTWTRGAAVGNRRREQGCETSHHGPLFVEVDKQGGQPTCLYPALSTRKTSDLKSCL